MKPISQKAPQVIVAQIGARMHYAVPALFHRNGHLSQLFTDAYAGVGSWMHDLLKAVPAFVKKGVLKRLAQRNADLPADKITAFNLLGLNFTLALYTPFLRHRISDIYKFYSRRFLEKVIASSYVQNATMAYSYTGASLELLQSIERKDIYCVVEQMAAPLQIFLKLLEEESDKWPEWETVEQRTHWEPDYWFPRERQEWELADLILAPSSFVRDALIEAQVKPEKIKLIPYAVALSSFSGQVHRYSGLRPLRVLFAGTVGTGKGVPYLLEALDKLGANRVQARLLGTANIRPEKLVRYNHVAEVYGRVPRKEMKKHYAWADLFVLPSICEGSATVTYEARAAGLPVIATPNTGAWIEEGVDGVTVPIRDADALAETLLDFIRHPDLVEKMSRKALENAPNFSWEAYQRRLNKLVTSIHKGRNIDSLLS